MEMLHTILCPLLFLLAGGFLLPALWNLLFGQRQPAVDPAWETKLCNAERDLESARAELRTHKSELATLRVDLTSATNRLQDKESALVELEASANAAAQLKADLQAKDAELAQLKTEWALKLKEAEIKAAADLATARAEAVPAANLTAELATVKTDLAGKDGEIGKLLARVAELAPLALQLKDRDLRLRNIETEISAAAQGKDDEIARLTAELAATAQAHAAATGQLHERLGGLESDTAQLNARLTAQLAELDKLRQQLDERDERLREADNQLFDLETRYKALEKEKISAIAERDNESQKLKLRMGELEFTAANAAAALAKADTLQPDLEAKLRDLAASHQLALGEKDAEVARLRLRIAALERADASGKTRLAELEANQSAAVNDAAKDAAKDKDAALRLLQLRVKELEPLSAQLAERDLRLDTLKAELSAVNTRLTGQLDAAATAKDSEIAQLKLELVKAGKAQAVELNRLGLRLNELRGVRTLAADLQSRLTATQTGSESELIALKGRLATLEPLAATGAARAGELAQLAGALKLKDAELRQLHERISAAETAQQQHTAVLGARETELAQLRATLGERETKLSEWETRHQQTVAEKDETLGKLKWRVGELETFISNRDEEAGKLKWRINELEVLGAQSSGQDDELAKLRWRVGELEASAGQYDAKLNAREAQFNSTLSAKNGEIAQLIARLAELGTASARAAADADELRRLRLRLSELEAVPPKRVTARDAMEAYRLAPPNPGEYDDLELIYGVGPVLAKLLQKLGIYFFKQVAAWDEADIDYVDEQLEHFKGRIRRENWVDSAQEEHLKKYGVQL